MSILIKGMKMPKSCSDCFAEQCIGSDFGCGIIGFEDGNTTCFTRERRKDCPLVEVPPHGRLIDADALMQSFHDEFDDEEVHDFECGAYWFHGSVINHVINSPIIIPAEDET